MDFRTTHSWTLGGLVISFVDLLLAYFLLCGSFLAFLGSMVCEVFGVYLPCPCCGFFGYRNSDLCLHKLFVESPVRIICYVQLMARSRFPFCPVPCKDQASDSDMKLIGDGRKCGNEALEPEGESEASCSSLGQDSRVSPSQRSEINQSLGEEEDDLQGDGFSATSIDMSERSWNSLEESEDTGDSSMTTEKLGDEVSRIRMLERALEEERAGSEALRLELEKERAAAASATDEAMAMMLRLQTDKALLDMEAKQAKRLMEEKLAHEEDEMNVLADVVVRMETENRFLERELEAYRQMRLAGKEQVECE